MPFTLYGVVFQLLLISINLIISILQPQLCLNNAGLGYSKFARHYYWNHYCFLFLQLLRCFSSLSYFSSQNIKTSFWWIPSFGNLRFIDFLHLAEAYRSFTRPSSSLRAKASTVYINIFTHHSSLFSICQCTIAFLQAVSDKQFAYFLSPCLPVRLGKGRVRLLIIKKNNRFIVEILLNI